MRLVAVLAAAGAGAGAGAPPARPTALEPPPARWEVGSSSCNVGAFTVSVDAGAGVVRAADAAGGAVAYESLPGRAFAWLLEAEVSYAQSDGFFHFDMETADNAGWEFASAASVSAEQIVSAAACDAGASLTLTGELRMSAKNASVGWAAEWRADGAAGVAYSARFDTPRRAPPYPGAVSGPAGGAATVAVAAWAAVAGDGMYGFGEQYNYLDLEGRVVPVWTREAGAGRGLQPLTETINAATAAHLGGAWYTTYAALPYYATRGGRAAWLNDSAGYNVFDLRRPGAVVVARFPANAVAAHFAACGSVLGCVSALTARTGRMQRLPDWAHRGAIVGTEFGRAAIEAQLAQLRALGTPVSGVWYQDWAGIRPTSNRKAVWWNWVADNETYPGWPDWVAALAAEGIATLVYFNPMLLEKPGVSPNYYREAVDSGYVLADAAGAPVEAYGAVTLDLTNPAAAEFYKGIVRREALAHGVKGYMCDFGEAVPPGVTLHDGRDGWDAHNAYPDLWFEANRAAANGSRDVMFFGRSYGMRSAAPVSLMWSGDQLTSWDGYTGMGAALGSLISSGISGVALQHSDIGGYKSIAALGYARSAELFMRWCEMSAFTAMYRTHPGATPADDAQFDSSNATLAQYDRMAKVFASLFAYRSQLMAEMEDKGWPLARALLLHYPDDADARAVRDQFLLGADMLVAPVLHKGATDREVYLPAGEWVDWWDASAPAVRGPARVRHPAPIGRPPVFHARSAAWAPAAQAEMRRLGVA